MSSSSSSATFNNTLHDEGHINPDEVFERLSDMFGMMASDQVILDVGGRNNWKLEDCIEGMIRYSCNESRSDTAVNSVKRLAISSSSAMQHDGLHFETASNGLVDAPPIFVPDATMSSLQNILSNTNSGTIPKTAKPSTSNTFQDSQLASSLLKHGSNSFVDTSPAQSKQPKMTTNVQPPEIVDCIHHIESGYKVMVIMRGAPGSGKSHLAHSLLQQTLPDAIPSNHIFSSDNYFMRANGSYQYDPQQVPDAHEFNQRTVRDKASLGWSPIFVDNTMIRVWEMYVYIEIAVRNGYIIRILEPNTNWRYSAGQLATRNRHGVRKQAIERMLRSFEPVAVETILRMPQFTYSVNIPQMRKFPQNYPAESIEVLAKTPPPSNPKPQRSRAPDKPPTVTRASSNPQDPKDTFHIAAQKLQQLGNEWTSYEKERGEFWTTSDIGSSDAARTPTKTQAVAAHVLPTNMIELLRDESTKPVTEKLTANATSSSSSTTILVSALEKHRIDCPSENTVFAHIRQIYPAVPGAYLWDLFQNCNGDAEWTLDILLKEETRVEQYDQSSGATSELCCDCDRIILPVSAVVPVVAETVLSSNAGTPFKVSKRDRLAYQNLELRRQIEETIVIDDTHYTEHTRRMRNLRYGTVTGAATTEATVTQTEVPSNQTSSALEPVVKPKSESSSDEASSSSSSDIETSDYIEINLGREVIEQLESIMGMDTIKAEQIIDVNSLKTNVFMPKILAQQLYALWIESVYNQMEEQRLQTVRADEEFARQLSAQQQMQQKSAAIAPKMNIKDVVEMECAWADYNAQIPGDAWKDSTNLATKITHGKLTESFPDVEADTLRNVLQANNNRFPETVNMLNWMLQTGNQSEVDIAKTTEELMNRAQLETEKVRTPDETRSKPINASVRPTKNVDSGEAKRYALTTFEECRNKAMHHTQMKAECYHKCKSAMQRGEGTVAVYYSRVANLHKARIDHFNHVASNCIMEVHNLTQTSPDILDLHYLFVTEAIECLDLFLDKHLSRLRAAPQPYKSLLVITGRGLHSTCGFATIKHRTKYRLKERGLNWSEVNPGLLRIKIFPNSYLSMDV